MYKGKCCCSKSPFSGYDKSCKEGKRLFKDYASVYRLVEKSGFNRLLPGTQATIRDEMAAYLNLYHKHVDTNSRNTNS